MLYLIYSLFFLVFLNSVGFEFEIVALWVTVEFEFNNYYIYINLIKTGEVFYVTY